jgi:hypothetical protein
MRKIIENHIIHIIRNDKSTEEIKGVLIRVSQEETVFHENMVTTYPENDFAVMLKGTYKNKNGEIKSCFTKDGKYYAPKSDL